MMEKITGLINAPFTPFYENGDVNYEPLGTYAEFLVKNGLKGVFVNGSSGEGYMLTDEERMKLAERWLEVSPADFKVMVHVGSTCARSSRRLAAHAQSVGAYAIGAMAPPFPRIGRVEELVAYCQEIACGAPRLPFYFYHIPAFNGVYLSMTEFLEAVDGRISNFAGIKYTYENLYEYNQCRLYKEESLICFMGRMKRFYRVWLWEEPAVVSVVRQIIMGVPSLGFWTLGNLVTLNAPGIYRILLSR